MPDTSAIAAIVQRLDARNDGSSLDVQMLCLAEEAGEVIQAYRRAAGKARRPGEWSKVAEELADVVIVSYVTAAMAGIDLDAAIAAKLEAIEARGGI